MCIIQLAVRLSKSVVQPSLTASRSAISFYLRDHSERKVQDMNIRLINVRTIARKHGLGFIFLI